MKNHSIPVKFKFRKLFTVGSTAPMRCCLYVWMKRKTDYLATVCEFIIVKRLTLHRVFLPFGLKVPPANIPAALTGISLCHVYLFKWCSLCLREFIHLSNNSSPDSSPARRITVAEKQPENLTPLPSVTLVNCVFSFAIIDYEDMLPLGVQKSKRISRNISAFFFCELEHLAWFSRGILTFQIRFRIGNRLCSTHSNFLSLNIAFLPVLSLEFFPSRLYMSGKKSCSTLSSALFELFALLWHRLTPLF